MCHEAERPERDGGVQLDISSASAVHVRAGRGGCVETFECIKKIPKSEAETTEGWPSRSSIAVRHSTPFPAGENRQAWTT